MIDTGRDSAPDLLERRQLDRIDRAPRAWAADEVGLAKSSNALAVASPTMSVDRWPRAEIPPAQTIGR